MAYGRGDVVLVPFPFTDLSTSSVRPAVVISRTGFEIETGDLLLAMVTSRTRSGSTDLALQDWQAAGLIRPSWVRARVATIEEGLVLHSPGKLTDRDIAGLNSCLCLALDLP